MTTPPPAAPPGTNPDWPFGPQLRAHREQVGLSMRAAARSATISESKWRQLETGWVQAGRGHWIPTGSTPQTVAAAARAVHWDVAEALALAGFNADRYQHLDPAVAAPDERVPGFAELTEAQRAAVVDLVASILAGPDTPTPPPTDRRRRWPVRVGDVPDDLLGNDDARVFQHDTTKRTKTEQQVSDGSR